VSMRNSQPEPTPEDVLTELRRNAEIQAWLISHLAEALEINPEAIDVKAPLDRYGLDSYVAVNLVGELEDWLGRELSPTLPYDYPTVESLAHHLSDASAISG
jgi:acyl carrier protein